MKNTCYKLTLMALLSSFMLACSNTPSTSTNSSSNIDGISPASATVIAQANPLGPYPTAKNGDVLLGNKDYQAISYGAWRSSVRESGPLVPSVAQQKEDMKILAAMGYKVIRTYNTQNFIGLDGKSNTQNLLEAIAQLMAEDPNFEMYVMLGIWIEALHSFTNTPVIHDKESAGNALEMAAGIALAKKYSDIVKVIAVGNEAMVHWAPYHVSSAIILKHVNALQDLKAQGVLANDVWITSSDNHASWGSLGTGTDNPYDNGDLKALIKAVDFVSLHTYPFHDSYYDEDFWLVPASQAHLSVKQKVDAAMLRATNWVITQTADAQAYMLALGVEKQIHIGETGWASVANVNYGDDGSRAANEYNQKVFYDAMRSWSNEYGASMFLFQAFDEPWKGSANNPGDSEKHFGLIDINGNAKYVAWDKVDTLNSNGLTRSPVATFNKSFNGDEKALMQTVLAPKPILQN